MFDARVATRRLIVGLAVLLLATIMLFAGIAAAAAVVFPSAPVVVRVVAGVAAIPLLVGGGLLYRRGWRILRAPAHADYWRDYKQRRPAREAHGSPGE